MFHKFSKLYKSLISCLNKCTITDPASTIIQSHFGLPSGEGQYIPNFFNFSNKSSAVALACLVDLHVAIIKLSEIEDLFDKSITCKFSALALSKIDKILSFNEELLIFTSKFFSLISNFCRRYFDFFILNNYPRWKLIKIF